MFKRFSNIQFLFFFVENDIDRFKSLDKELARFWSRYSGGKPSNVVIKTYNEVFKSAVVRMVQIIRSNRRPVPAFVFIDPFGFSGIPMSVIHDLLSLEKCEVLINFMYDSVKRFISTKRPDLVRNFSELFGTDEQTYRSVLNLDVNDQKRFLASLYMDNLRKAGRCKFVDSFELWDNSRGRTLYFLIFGTHSVTGLKKMKEVMWLLDPVAGEISAKGDMGQISLPLEPDLSELQEAILSKFIGQQATIEEIELFVTTDTNYVIRHARTVLKQLERENMIECLSERKQRGVFPPSTILHFKVSNDRLFELKTPN